MHYHDLSYPANSAHPTLDYHRAAYLLTEQQFAPDSPAAGMRHLADCTEFIPHLFKTPADFHHAIAVRKEWCRRYAHVGYAVEPLDGDAKQNRLRLRFSIGPVAALFGLLHTAWSTRSSKAGA